MGGGEMSAQELDPEILSAEGLAAWRSGLPDDLRSALGDADIRQIDSLPDFCRRLSAVPESELPAYLESNLAVLKELNRTGRMRLLAWMAKNYYFDFPEAMVEIFAREDDDEEGRQSGTLFAEDVAAIIE